MTTPSPLQTWLLASRPRTLPAAATPVIVGSAAAMSTGHFSAGPALAALLGALLLQIGANLANDVFDYQKGVDTSARLGPLRVTQAGLLTSKQVLIGMGVVFGLAALCGVYLIAVSGWPVLVVGLASILAAMAYTGGPYPLGYHGLGEVAVFAFFGPVAVVGTYYVQANSLDPLAWWASIPIGLLTVAILVVNNLRDITTDRATGKMTLAARFGVDWARKEYILVVALAYLFPFLMLIAGASRAWALLPWVSLPIFIQRVQDIHRLEGRALNKLLGDTGQLELVFGMLFSLGLLLNPLLG